MKTRMPITALADARATVLKAKRVKAEPYGKPKIKFTALEPIRGVRESEERQPSPLRDRRPADERTRAGVGSAAR